MLQLKEKAKILSLLLFWLMEASILMVVDNIDDSFCMK